MLFRIISVAAIYALLTSCAYMRAPAYDAIVDHSSTSGNNFSSLQAALDAAPSSGNKPFRIFISAGDYFEKIIIAKPNVYLRGAGKNATRIFYNAYAGQQSTDIGATPGQIWGTPGSSTVIVRAANIRIEALTVENTFDFIANDALAGDDPKRIANTQAVALFLDNGSDKFLARDIRLLGYQDTLFVNAGRSWFDQSFIAGNVDFIFGKGNALFTDSEIHTLGRGNANSPHGYLVAPSTQLADEYGLTFISCRLTRAVDVPDNSVYLGRPWHPTTQFPDGRYADPQAVGKAVFIDSWMDAHIAADGWSSMSGTGKNGIKIPFLPEDSRFFEYKSTGSGAQINSQRRQLSDVESKQYDRKLILQSW
jgi:pectinesterase